MLPIKPEDASIFVDLFNTLSPTSVYYRFFRPVKSLTPDMLARFTQIDYDREIALVAIDEGEDGGRMLWVSRIIRNQGGFWLLDGPAFDDVGPFTEIHRTASLHVDNSPDAGFKGDAPSI